MKLTPLICLFIAPLAGCAIASTSTHVVSVPVADVRSKPGPLPTTYDHDPQEETQLLYGERVKLLKIDDAWALIEALEQPEFTHARRWGGYPGWILQDVLRQQPAHCTTNAVVTAKWTTVWQNMQGTGRLLQLPMGTFVNAQALEGSFRKILLVNGAAGWISDDDVTPLQRLEQLPIAQRRHVIVHAAELLIGDPYLWGGRSPHAGPSGWQVTGVDCSGLVNLSYRAAGIVIPRDAQEQFLRARAITLLKAGDLVFLSEARNPSKIVHVMLYGGDGWLLEGPGTGKSVRRILLVDRLQLFEEQITPGKDQIDHQTIYFGSLLANR